MGFKVKRFISPIKNTEEPKPVKDVKGFDEHLATL